MELRAGRQRSGFGRRGSSLAMTNIPAALWQ
jgi:hypothetical protein